MRLFLDMDGVVTDWSGAVCKLYGIDPYHPEAQKILRLDSWLEGWKFGTNKEVDALVKAQGYDFWYNLELLPWAHDLYNMMSKHGEVMFLTNPGKFHAAAHAKLDYLEDHFGSTSKYVLTKHKHLCAGQYHILVDDMLHNIKDWHGHGGTPWHWPNQWLLKENPDLVKKELDNLEALIIKRKELEEYGNLHVGHK